jgi:hypothetical protein
MAILATAPGDPRETALHRLDAETDSPLLHARILAAIRLDSSFQSRQADFIRRYGFYANGFNRLFYSLGRVIQGNVQSALQLGVDAVQAMTAPGEADAQTRLAYQKLERALAEAPTVTPADRTRLAALRDKVDRAMAAEDLDRARWAMQTGDPEAAAFYADQAVLLRHDWPKATRLRDQAEAEAARVRRQAVASRQVGYPDRHPPYHTADPALLRGILAGDGRLTSRTTPAEDLMPVFFATLATDQGSPPFHGRATMMRAWAPLLDKHRAAPEPERRWLAAMIQSPDHNPDMRLARARQRRRGQLLRFIFLGPETPRQQAYKAASWSAQSYQVLQNLGFFYVFEVLARAAQSCWAPPLPASEYLDARMAWLRQAPRPFDAESRAVAESLADDYQEQSRFEDARRLLAAANQLTPPRAERIDRTEAQRLVSLAEQAEQPEGRQALIARARELAPTVADEAKEPRAPKTPPRSWQLTWDALRRWSELPLPCGLPGAAAWFDGRLDNGEVSMDGVSLEETATTGTLCVTYPVLFPEERRVHQAMIARNRLSPSLRRWLELSYRQDQTTQAAIKRWDRLPVPFALEGSAGAAGVDVYPRLKPIENPETPLTLYQ